MQLTWGTIISNLLFGFSTLKNYRIFDEGLLIKENNKYIKEFIKRIKMESSLNLEICNEIS